MVDGAAFDLFRRHIRHRSHDDAFGSDGAGRPGRSAAVVPAGRFGESEIEHPHPAVVADHDVLGLEVTVGNASVMRGGQGVGRRVGFEGGNYATDGRTTSMVSTGVQMFNQNMSRIMQNVSSWSGEARPQGL